MNLKFWQRKNKVADAIDHLTEQLGEIERVRQEGAQELTEMLRNPEQLASIFQRAMTTIESPPAMRVAGTQFATTVPSAAAEAPKLLPSKALKKTIDTVTKAILAKMEEMEKHIRVAVSELPPDVLKRISDKVKAGEDFQLRRRHGCIYIDFGSGDDDYWLKL